jgi:voltage-gated sodium channel
VPNRDRVRALVAHKRFQQTIIAVIVVNGVTLALETFRPLMAAAGGFLHAVDHVTLWVFMAEIACRLYAHGWRFFRNPWNVFDFVIVGISLLPAAGALSVLRTLRVLRVLRLISAVPSMRRVVAGLLSAVPGMASIAALLGLIIFVAGVMATMLFRDAAPRYFGDMWTTMFTLFQTMTGEGWPEVAAAVMADAPLAWIFFVVYILVSSFAVLNLFIAVIVSAVEEQVTGELVQVERQRADDQARADDQLLTEIRALRAELAELHPRNRTPAGD